MNGWQALELHWLRPELALVWAAAGLVCLLLWLWQTRQSGQTQHKDWIDPELLQALSGSAMKKRRRQVMPALTIAFLLLGLAVAGPAWQKRESPVMKSRDALIVVLDLSVSMLAEDIKPSRLKQAQFIIQDVLKTRRDGQTALVVFSDDAYTVAPLTDDSNTLKNLLLALNPDVVPGHGSNPLAGLEQADSLLANAAIPRGRILLITDGWFPQQQAAISRWLQDSSHSVHVAGLGTEKGAPIPAPGGGFMSDQNGNIVVPGIDHARLQSELSGLADYRRGRLRPNDLQRLSQANELTLNEEQRRATEQWVDGGIWFALLSLPLCLLAFRKGVVYAVLMGVSLNFLSPTELLAQDSGGLIAPTQGAQNDAPGMWDRLWQRPDQLGASYFSKDDYDTAANLFEDRAWKATALYQAGRYKEAAQLWAETDTARAHYNRGNALAMSGQLPQAIEAYEQSLALNPAMKDAADNKALLEKLLEQKEQEQQQQEQEQQDSESGDKDEQSGQQDGEQASQQQGAGQNSDDGSEQSDADGDQQASESGDAGQQSGASDKAQSQQQQASDNGEQQAGDETLGGPQQLQEGDEQAQLSAARADPEAESEDSTEGSARGAALEESELLPEQQQALEQWLRRLPDEPGALMRRKFERQQQRRAVQSPPPQESNTAPW